MIPEALIPKLEETDRGIAAVVEVADPGADRPILGPMVKVVFRVGVGVGQVTLPGFQRRAVHAVDPIDALRVQLHVGQVLAKGSR